MLLACRANNNIIKHLQTIAKYSKRNLLFYWYLNSLKIPVFFAYKICINKLYPFLFSLLVKTSILKHFIILIVSGLMFDHVVKYLKQVYHNLAEN